MNPDYETKDKKQDRQNLEDLVKFKRRLGIAVVAGSVLALAISVLAWNWRQESNRLEDENAILSSDHQEKPGEVTAQADRAEAQIDISSVIPGVIERERDELLVKVGQEKTGRIAAEVELADEQAEHKAHHLELRSCRDERDRLEELLVFDVAIATGRLPAPRLFEDPEDQELWVGAMCDDFTAERGVGR